MPLLPLGLSASSKRRRALAFMASHRPDHCRELLFLLPFLAVHCRPLGFNFGPLQRAGTSVSLSSRLLWVFSGAD